MTQQETKKTIRYLAALAACATIAYGCASTEPPPGYPASTPQESGSASSAPASYPAGSGWSGPAAGEELEELVVTGSRIEEYDGDGRTTARDRSEAAKERPSRAEREAERAEQAARAEQARLAEVQRRRAARQAEATFARMSSDEELWVITKPPEDLSSAQDYGPGSGAMVARITADSNGQPSRLREIPLPLQHTAVHAQIDSYISTVDVEQQFSNPFDEKIEAVYLFPLPEKAAITEFVMEIGDRKIRGILREKEEAEAIYRQTKAQGYQASLLTQRRPNVFEQKVANIEPGHAIDVNIRYFHTLAYNDGWYSFVFPTVVGPRFNPPGTVDPIEPVARGTNHATSIEYLDPTERSGHDVSITVEIDAGVVIEELKSTHEINATRTTPASATVELANLTTIPNRDFVLNFRVAGETVKSNLMTYTDPASQQNYFTLMLYPPANSASLERAPVEMVFVLDCSGSMSGRPLRQAKAAVSAALDKLEPGDTFQIIRFSETSNLLGPTPLPATPENIRVARRYLDSLSGTGGTMMIEGVKAALDFPYDPGRLRFVTFMTDGYIGNETDIIGAVHDHIGAARIFSFGVGSSVNRYLLERMAKEGRGAVAYLGPQDSADAIMSDFFTRISRPAMTDVEIDWGSMVVSDVYPPQLPDLFAGRAVVVTGKYAGTASDLGVSGRQGIANTSFVVDADAEPRPAISKLWARLRIADLKDRQAWQQDPYGELENAIRTTALEHQLVSDYTSFVAVDASRRTEGEYGVTVPQPVPVPDGVRYETTVDQR